MGNRRTDRYVTYDYETDSYVDRYHSEDELNEHLQELGKTRASFVRRYEALDTFERNSVLSEFKEEAEAIIDEIESLEGELYTDEGKQAEIKKRLQELAEVKKQESQKIEADYKERHVKLLRDMDKEINSHDEQLSSNEVAEINLRNNELKGQIKGQLYAWNDTRTLEHEFKMLVEKSKDDKTLSRFLQNNYYMFLDKIQQLDTGEMDKQRATSIILAQADKLKRSNYSSKERALLAVRDKVGKRSFTMSDGRLIDQHLQKYLRNYK